MKYKLLDLFCGAGGLSLGFERAGFSVLKAVDTDPWSVSTYNHNRINKVAEVMSVTSLTSDYLNSLGAIDGIIGGPPCQGFSNANRWQKNRNDPRNKLFFEYLKFVEVLRPKVILIENVKGILSRNNGFAKLKIESLINDLGYNVRSKVLLASDFGIPQYRQRAFFVCIDKQYKNIFFDFNNLLSLREFLCK